MRHRHALVHSGSRLIFTVLLGLWCRDIAAAQEATRPQSSPPAQSEPAAPEAAPPKARARGHDEKRESSEHKKAEARVKQAQKAEKKPDLSTPKIAAPPAPPTPQAPASPQAPVVSQPAAPQSTSEPIGEFEPVIHARNAKITTCMDKIVGLSARVIDRPHSSVSTYVAAAPNDHVFQSIIGMNYPNKVAPNGAAVIIAAPIDGSRCEGETVQIYPTTNSCTAVQAALINNGRTLTTLRSLPLLQTKDGNRELLMPTAGGGCVVVSIGLH